MFYVLLDLDFLLDVLPSPPGADSMFAVPATWCNFPVAELRRTASRAPGVTVHLDIYIHLNMFYVSQCLLCYWWSTSF